MRNWNWVPLSAITIGGSSYWLHMERSEHGLQTRKEYQHNGTLSAAGVLNLIDLAGSERLSKSLASGDRMKETQAINKSLSALGMLVFAHAAANQVQLT